MVPFMSGLTQNSFSFTQVAPVSLTDPGEQPIFHEAVVSKIHTMTPFFTTMYKRAFPP